MLSMDATQLAIIANTVKSVSWVFDVRDINLNQYLWSTKYISGVASFKIINFDGVTLARPRTEDGIMPPSELTFSVINSGNVYAPADFENGYVTLHLYMGNGSDAEVEIRAWKFLVNKVEGTYQQLHFTCEDFFTQYIEGDYPGAQYLMESTGVGWDAGVGWIAGVAWVAGTAGSTALTYGVKVKDIFPSADGDIEDDVCMPLPFGTAYVPIRSAYISTDRYYVLGPTIANGAAVTYAMSACRSPRGYGTKVTYPAGADDPPTTYLFDQYTKVSTENYSFRTVQPMIAGSHPETVGIFANGDNFYDVPIKFTRSDTATLTNPADVIEYVLKDMGVAAADIGTSFATAHTTFDGWGLTFNGAFWQVISREKALTQLLSMCHATLNVEETVELNVLDSTSRKTITSADIIKGSEVGVGTFQYSAFTRTLAECGNLSYSPTDDAQDIGLNALIPAKSSRTHIDQDVFYMPFVQDATIAALVARLYLQRKLLKKSEERFTAKATCIALQPGDFITVSGVNYGGAHDLIVDSMKINKDVSIDFVCSGFSDTIENYA